MGNAFKGLFNRGAQELTAAIDDATNVVQQENSQNIGSLAVESVEESGDNRGEQAVVAGQMVSEVMSQGAVPQEVSVSEMILPNNVEQDAPMMRDLPEVTPREVAQATEDLTLAEERNEGLRGYEDEISPAVERAELAHEQNLAQIEEDAERDANWGDERAMDDHDWGENGKEQSGIALNQAENPSLQQYDEIVAPKFVKNERAIAEGTKAAVEKVTSGKQDTRIVDIVTLYERSANAMREIGKAV